MVDLDKMTWDDYLVMSDEERSEIFGKLGPFKTHEIFWRIEKERHEKLTLWVQAKKRYGLEPDNISSDGRLDSGLLDEFITLKFIQSDIPQDLKEKYIKQYSLTSFGPTEAYRNLKEAIKLYNEKGVVPEQVRLKRYQEIADKFYEKWIKENNKD